MNFVQDPRILLITANVGSIFEDPDVMLKQWMDEFIKHIRSRRPALVALHCQEVGGKNYEQSMQHVNAFIKALLSHPDLQQYDRARIYLDEDFTAVDKFTALGNLYFVHESLQDIQLWNFKEKEFENITNRDVCSGNIDSVPTKEKAKFPKHFFPDFAWSRKGYLRTRWRVQGVCFELVNIHLFHDASNLVAMDSSPSLYCNNRKNALLHTLDVLDQDHVCPYFLFGDFNFRLDQHLLVERLTADLACVRSTGKNGDVTRVEWRERDNDNKVIMVMEKKFFDLHDLEKTFLHEQWPLQFDRERDAYNDRLHEQNITFPPSYPFSEDATDGTHYMKTRTPAWCDRILYSPACEHLMEMNSEAKPTYDVMGRDICMGDHKPIFLQFGLRGCRKYRESSSPPTGNATESANRVVAAAPVQPEHVMLDVAPAVVSPVVACSTRLSGPRLSVNGEDVHVMATLNIHANAMFEVEDALPDSIIDSRTSGGSEKRSFRSAAHSVQRCSSVIKHWQHVRHHSSSSEDEPLHEVVSRSALRRRSYQVLTEAHQRRQVERYVSEIVAAAIEQAIQEHGKQEEGTPRQPPNPPVYAPASHRRLCPCALL